MLHSRRQIRFVLFLVAGLLGLAASYVRFAELVPFEPSYVSSATYRSDLLADTLSLYAVRSVVESPEFQRTAGARITFSGLSGEPTSFRLSSEDLVQQRAETSLDNARELMRIKLRALALAEVDASRGYLEQLREESRLGRRAESKNLEDRSSPAELQGSILSDQKRERASLLRREIDGLVKFLRYQDRPDWFDARVDSGALRGAQRDVEGARDKLLELREVFTAKSSVAKAQAKLLEKKRSQLRALEKHLARALLRSHRNELKGMEASALVAVEQSAVTVEEEPGPLVDPAPSEAPDDDWLRLHSEQLDSQTKSLEKKASLQQLSDAFTQLTRPVGYWLSGCLWLGSLALLLGALFVRPSGRSGKTSVPRIAVEGTGPTEGKPWPTLDVKATNDELFEQLAKNLLREGVGSGRHLLVLGRQGQGRSSLSLRLAQQLAEGGGRVRLVDFDFKNRPLSERVGDPASPGVSDLLSRSGPVEEFFASLPGTSIQFAPAGTSRFMEGDRGDVDWLFPLGNQGLTVIDAGFFSPLHLFLHRMNAVVCLYQPGQPWSELESGVLERLRSAGCPIWGVALDGSVVSRLF